jgi:excisionase family DNA binding protein
MSEASVSTAGDKELLTVEDVAKYMGVGRVTVHRWCREGRLPCSKVGKSWRVRREALEDLLRRGERSVTLEGQLGSFLSAPDSVLIVAQNLDLLHRIDAAFFRIGEARGALLVKFYGGEAEQADDLRAQLEQEGVDIERLEAEGRLIMRPEKDPASRRGELLRLLEKSGEGRDVWASFNWALEVDLDTAIEQQEALSKLVDAEHFVIKTAIVEEAAVGWTTGTLMRAQTSHSGIVWASEKGLSLSRTIPMPGS